MTYRGFCAGSNPVQSVIADAERCSNFYPERSESQAAPTDAALYPTPGLTGVYAVPDLDTSAIFEMNGRAFAIVGPTFYELFADGTNTSRGTVAHNNNPGTISSNGVAGQLLITSGGNAYSFILATNTFAAIAALAGKATQGGEKDGFGLCFDASTSTVYVSALNDFTSWTTGTAYFQRSIASDPWKAMIVRNPAILLIGEFTGEAWFNTGASTQPFAPNTSAFFQAGTPAGFSVAKAGDVIVWLAQTQEGGPRIMRMQGYTPQPISNYAVETQLARFRRAGTLNDCETVVYEQDGHLWACFNFPSGHVTWCVDLETGQWHERHSLNAMGVEDVWRVRVSAPAFGLNLAGDRSTGTIGKLDVTVGSEYGTTIRRRRVGPPLWARDNQRLVVSRLNLIMDVGVGLTSGQGADPVVMLRTTENGFTWSSERQASAGPLGRYARNVFWTRAGSSTKIWFPEIVVTDPVQWRIAGAEVFGSGFQQLSPQSAAA